MVIADASVPAHPPVTHENTDEASQRISRATRAGGNTPHPAAFFLIGVSISCSTIIPHMDFQPPADKDVASLKPPEMHRVSRLLAEAQQILQHNDRIIARNRNLVAMDVLSDRPPRHRPQKGTLG
jgi:hypothetical protein